MSKKIFFTILTILTFAFSFTYVFAADGLQGAADNVRNVVGGAENTIENAAKGVSNTRKNMTKDVENAGKTVTNDTKNTTGKVENTMTSATKDNHTTYTATRTATNNPTFMGMSSNTWTWLILGIAAIVIIGLVWYYSMQLTGNNYDDGNND